MAEMLGEFVREFGVRIVGGCCGTTPEHLARDRRARCAQRRTRRPSGARAHATRTCRASSSAMRAIDLHQDPPPLLVGERVNAQGSRKVKRLLLADDYEGIVDVAREQVESGAHVLDVCVALTERARRSRADGEGRQAALDERRDADHDRLDRGRRSSRRALEHMPGRAIINSINMENGRKRIDARRAAREEARRGARRADDRRGRHGEDARAEARGRAEDLRHRRRRVRARRPRI